MKKLIVLSAACGVGKSTIKEALNESKILDNYSCIDTDEVGINWWDYAGTEHGAKFSDDCLAEAVRMSNNKNLLFATCMNPYDFYGAVIIPRNITSTFFIPVSNEPSFVLARAFGECREGQIPCSLLRIKLDTPSACCGVFDWDDLF